MKHTFIALVVLNCAAQAAAQSTGYPACDRYISMVTECIRTKMPESKRADRQKELDQFRVMLANFVSAETAPRACEENIRLEMQRDRYGCYAARAAAGVRTARSLVTPADLQSALGVAFAPGAPGNSKCGYDFAAPPPRLVEIEVSWNDGAEHMSRGGRLPRRAAGDEQVNAPSGSGVRRCGRRLFTLSWATCRCRPCARATLR